MPLLVFRVLRGSTRQREPSVLGGSSAGTGVNGVDRFAIRDGVRPSPVRSHVAGGSDARAGVRAILTITRRTS
jgi:hypothetical protein